MGSRPKELRCFCRGKPLLATYGLDSKGKLFVHVRIYKQDRIYGELIIVGGEVKLRCRNCLRWHRVIFKEQTVALTEDQSPESRVDNDAPAMLDRRTI